MDTLNNHDAIENATVMMMLYHNIDKELVISEFLTNPKGPLTLLILKPRSRTPDS